MHSRFLVGQELRRWLYYYCASKDDLCLHLAAATSVPLALVFSVDLGLGRETDRGHRNTFKGVMEQEDVGLGAEGLFSGRLNSEHCPSCALTVRYDFWAFSLNFDVGCQCPLYQ